MIGLLPAAGTATRIHGLPKFLLPVPGGYLLQRHVELMQASGVATVMVGASPDTFDFVRRYAPGVEVYLASWRETMTQTVFSSETELHSVLFGMPDTYFSDTHAYKRLMTALEDGAEVAVGVFKARPGQHKHGGMCRIEGSQITDVIDKPDATDYQYIWGVLAWRPAFWDCLRMDEPHVGYGLPRAIEGGMDVRAIELSGEYWDCGSVEEYFRMVQQWEGITA